MSHFLHEIRTKYQMIHIIAALITGALYQTKIVNKIIIVEISTNLIGAGNIFTKYPKNIIKMVILNQETAMKCVSQELLKLSLKVFGRFSLAQTRIHHRKIASSFV